MSDRLTVVLAGGGTGGHIFPALAVVEQLRRMKSEGLRCVSLCSQKPLDRAVLERSVRGGSEADAHEIESVHAIAARPLRLDPKGFADLAKNWAGAVGACRTVLRDEKLNSDRVLVFATGGYVTVPAWRAAKLEGVTRWLVNLDVVPGKANAWAMRHADCVFDAALAASTDTWKRSVPRTHVGPLLRSCALAHDDRVGAAQRLGFDAHRPVLLVTGGSLGARTIARFVEGCIRRDSGAWKERKWQVLHQAPKEEMARLQEIYTRAEIDGKVVEFISNMGDAWTLADLHLGRAGAGSVAEIAASGVPSLLMPYPFHRDRHQELNAAVLVDRGIAWMLQDAVDGEANVERYGSKLFALLRDHATGVVGRQAGATKVAEAAGGEAGPEAELEVSGIASGERNREGCGEDGGGGCGQVGIGSGTEEGQCSDDRTWKPDGAERVARAIIQWAGE